MRTGGEPAADPSLFFLPELRGAQGGGMLALVGILCQRVWLDSRIQPFPFSYVILVPHQGGVILKRLDLSCHPVEAWSAWCELMTIMMTRDHDCFSRDSHRLHLRV